MSYYDKEMNIISELFSLSPYEILVMTDNKVEHQKSTENIIKSIIDRNYFLNNWKDNTKSSSPPDFINEKDKLLMEVMRVDDHSKNGKKNPYRQKEFQMEKELEKIGLSNIDCPIFCLPYTDLPTDLDHNYSYYLNSFDRAINKHKSKIPSYKNNHNIDTLIFFIFDETSGFYFEDNEDKKLSNTHFFDLNIVEKFINSGADYVIWYTPNAYNDYYEMFLPKVTIFDIKNIQLGIINSYKKFNVSKMKSSEE